MPRAQGSLGQLAAAFVAAVVGSTVGATATFFVVSLVLGARGTFGEVPGATGLFLVYSLVGVTILGPIGLFVRARSGRSERWILVGVGGLLGCLAMVLASAFAGNSPLNPVVASGTGAGACAAWGYSLVRPPGMHSA